MNKYSLSALVAAGLLAGGLATSANAADLGGNCCADLEERIAELEATTARKGNRKVSLTVSGWVGQQISFWDDGIESNSYVHDLGSTLGSHVKFTGSAQISPGWSAGYVLHIEAISSDSLTINADRPVGPAALVGTTSGVQTLQSYWFVKSDQLGKLGVGKQSQASDNTAILVDGSGSLVPANWVAYDVNSFAIRTGNGGNSGLVWGGGYCGGQGGAWGDCNGLTRNVVRYDSPTFGGFSVSASWGEDDMWDVAGRYAGEHHGFKLAVAAAYNEWTDQVQTGVNAGLGQSGDNEYFQLGVYVQHVATGLFALYNYGHNEIDNVASVFPNDTSGESDTHYIKAGLRTKFNHLGATVFYGEYLNAQGEDALSQADLAVAGNPFLTEDETEVWGLGVVQEVDAAAMSVWVKYRHLSIETNDDAAFAGAGGLEDFQYVGVGGLINF
ncbi:MAG: porin [Hyphomicrobium sp.]|nr:porin [Hyphomicrobium sp.]